MYFIFLLSKSGHWETVAPEWLAQSLVKRSRSIRIFGGRVPILPSIGHTCDPGYPDGLRQLSAPLLPNNANRLSWATKY